MAQAYRMVVTRTFKVASHFEYQINANSESEAILELRRRLDNNIPGTIVGQTPEEEDEVYPLRIIDEAGCAKDQLFYWNRFRAQGNTKKCRCGKPARYVTAFDGGFCRACAKDAGLL